MLEYSSKTRGAVDRFFKFRNDIDIYTEDKIADKEFYRVFFNRINAGTIKINDVTPLGSKTLVLSKYNEFIAKKSSRKKVFIIDGDLDLITNTNPPQDDYLYIHNVYCVENYLIDEDAIVELIYYNDGEKSKEEIKQILGFDDWINSISCLCQLFFYCAILKAYGGGPEIKHATSFLKNNAGSAEYDEQKCLAYRDEIIGKCILKIGEQEKDPEKVLAEFYNKLSAMWPISRDTLLKVVSGKDYLLPLVQFKINSLVNKNSCIPNKGLKLFLVNKCDVSSLDNLKAFLEAN